MRELPPGDNFSGNEDVLADIELHVPSIKIILSNRKVLNDIIMLNRAD